jgi:polyhydroxyalkanoate synthesis regulator phasin
MQQGGGKVTNAATETFIAAREDNLSREVQRQSPELTVPMSGGGAADVDRIIAEKERVVDNTLSEIADMEYKVIENCVARGRLSAEEGRQMMEVLRGVNEKSKADSRKRLEEEKMSLLKKVSKK